MSRSIGIDIGTTSVKIAIVRKAGAKLVVEHLREVEVAGTSIPEALGQLAKEAASKGDPIAVSFPGSKTWSRLLEIPPAVRARIDEVLPFELEAQIPFELDSVVYDKRPRAVRWSQDDQGVWSTLKVAPNAALPILVVGAATSDVKSLIESVTEGTGRQPDMVCPGGFAYGEWLNALDTRPKPPENTVSAVIDIGQSSTQILLATRVDVLAARTLPYGINTLTVDPDTLISQLQLSFSSFTAAGHPPPESVHLTGGGAYFQGLAALLSRELELPCELASFAHLATPQDVSIHRYSRAIALALANAPRALALNLRRGSLSYERGFAFLREWTPMLVGLGIGLFVSFMLSVWARAAVAGNDQVALVGALKAETKEVFGEETGDLDRVRTLLGQRSVSQDEDPLPKIDAMDVIQSLSDNIPATEMKHDIEKFEFSKGPQGFRLNLLGVAPSPTDIDKVESVIKAQRCMRLARPATKDKTVSERWRYGMEIEVRCPEEGGAKTASSATAAASASGATSGGPTP